jgi:hypothetical protein
MQCASTARPHLNALGWSSVPLGIMCLELQALCFVNSGRLGGSFTTLPADEVASAYGASLGLCCWLLGFFFFLSFAILLAGFLPCFARLALKLGA